MPWAHRCMHRCLQQPTDITRLRVSLAACKMCSTAFGLSTAAESVFSGCLCPDGQRRVDGVTGCAACGTGLDCAWTRSFFNSSSYYIGPTASSSTVTVTDRIYALTANQTTPYVLPGFWAEASAPHAVFKCRLVDATSVCGGGRIGINLCKGGRQGALCTSCPEGERPTSELACRKCDGGRDTLLGLFALTMAILLLYTVHRVCNRPEISNKLSSTLSVYAAGCAAAAR